MLAQVGKSGLKLLLCCFWGSSANLLQDVDIETHHIGGFTEGVVYSVRSKKDSKRESTLAAITVSEHIDRFWIAKRGCLIQETVVIPRNGLLPTNPASTIIERDAFTVPDMKGKPVIFCHGKAHKRTSVGLFDAGTVRHLKCVNVL